MEALNKIQSQNSLDKIPQAFKRNRDLETSKMPRGLLVAEAKAPQLWLGGSFPTIPTCSHTTLPVVRDFQKLLLLYSHVCGERDFKGVYPGCSVEIRKWPGNRASSRAPRTLQSLTQCSFLVSLPVCCSAGVDGRMKGLMFNTVAVYGLAAAGYRLSLSNLF